MYGGLILLILISLMTPKPGDFTTNNPFYSVERFYIAIPYFYITLISYIGKFYYESYASEMTININLLRNQKIMIITLVTLVFLFTFNLSKLDIYLLLNKEKMISNPAAMQIVDKKELEINCNNLKDIYLKKK